MFVPGEGLPPSCPLILSYEDYCRKSGVPGITRHRGALLLGFSGPLRFRSLVGCGGVTRPHPGDILKITQHLCASQRMTECFAPCRACILSPAAWQAATVSVFLAAPGESNPGEVVRRMLAKDCAVPPSTRAGRLVCQDFECHPSGHSWAGGESNPCPTFAPRAARPFPPGAVTAPASLSALP